MKASRHSCFVGRLATVMLCGLLVFVLTGCGLVTITAPTATPTSIPTATATPVPSPTPLPTATATPIPTATPRPPTPITGPLAQVISSGLPSTGMVGLTLDIGVTGPGEVPHTLDILRDNGIHATFFVIGTWAEKNPDILQRILAEGHEIGNHSYDHPDFCTISDAEIIDQMQQTEAIISQSIGITPKPYMRPPFGSYDNRVLALMNQLGYSVVTWTLDSTDWRDDSTVDSVIAWTTSHAKAGDIIVAHAHAEKTTAALPSIISGLQAKGLRIGTLSQVLGR